MLSKPFAIVGLLGLASLTLGTALSPVCERTQELGKKANGRQIWCYTMNGDQESCESSYVVRNGKRHGCVFNAEMGTFSSQRRRNPTGPGRCILEKRMAKFECGLLNHKKIVTRGIYTPPGPNQGETKEQCLADKAQNAANVNFKIDCEAEREEEVVDSFEEEDIEGELVAEAEAEAHTPVSRGKGSPGHKTRVPTIGEPVAHAPGELINLDANEAGDFFKPDDQGAVEDWDTGLASEKMFGQDDAVHGISYQPMKDEAMFWVGLQGHAEREIEGHDADFVFAHNKQGWLEIWEDGERVYTVTQWVDDVGDVGRWNTDSVMAIAVNSEGKVEYSLDGDVQYTSAKDVVYPIVATAAFNTPGAGVVGLAFDGEEETPEGQQRRLQEGDDEEDAEAEDEEDYDDEADAEDVDFDAEDEEDYDDEADAAEAEEEDDDEEEEVPGGRRLRGGN